MSQQRLCPRCQTSYSQGESFCLQDGSPLVERPPGGRDDPRIGALIADRFVLLERIRSGGMGAVYRAMHRVLDREFAIKLLHRELLTDATALQRFHREARATSAVAHPHIVSLYDYGTTADNEPYLAMEFVEGVTLFELAASRPGRRLPVSQAVDIALQIAQALSHAHGCGVVHRDIKPENVLLTTHDDRPDWVKLLDFGVARIVGLPPLTRLGDDSPGTPAFMAPELFQTGADVGSPINREARSAAAVDREARSAAAVDLYALGILLHDIVAGSPPFAGSFGDLMEAHLSQAPEALSSRCKGSPIPAELDELCASLLRKDARSRPTAAETAARLEAIRPRLPPRSVRSSIITQTYILQAHERGRALREAPTLLLPRAAPTLVLAAVLREVDRAEDDLDRASAALAEQIHDLLSRQYRAAHKALPAPLRELHGQLKAAAHAEEEAGVELALLREKAEEAQAQARARRAELHPRILMLSQALQGRPLLQPGEVYPAADAAPAPPPPEVLAALEREYAACEPGPELAAEQGRCQAHIQELRGELHRLRRQQAELALQGAAEHPELVGMCAGLRRTLDQFDGASATLALLLRRLPR